MDNAAALSILRTMLDEYRGQSYQALAAMVGRIDVREATAPDGSPLQIELAVLWEHKPHGAVIVIGSVDDGGLRAFCPLTLSFLRNPDGSVAGD